MPIVFAVRMTRHAIAPRLAIRILVNIPTTNRKGFLFPPCGGRLRSLSERSELRRSWMGGAAARWSGAEHPQERADAPSIAKHFVTPHRPSCGTPHPNLPP